MHFNEYQVLAQRTAIYPSKGTNLVYPALKLCGEAGEVAEKIGKLMRDKAYVVGGNTAKWESSSEQLEWEDALIKELGDVLWYVAAIATELNIDLDYIAAKNIDKLARRMQAGTLRGSGDNR